MISILLRLSLSITIRSSRITAGLKPEITLLSILNETSGPIKIASFTRPTSISPEIITYVNQG